MGYSAFTGLMEGRLMATVRDGLNINGMRLRNRLALPPLTTNYATSEGAVTDRILRFYKDRSRDVGLVIVEATAVRPDGRLVPNSLGLWEDGHVAGMARLAGAIKKAGAAAVVQINHAGARSVPTGGELQGASPSGFRFRPDVEPLEMSEDQIDRVVADFSDAAARAAEAGFDGVEIHGAHFYLISQFLSPLTNRRKDRYGGDAPGRATLAVEAVKAVRERVGKGVPLLFRLNAVEKVEGGQTFEDALSVCRLLAGGGNVDALDISVIAQSSWREVGGLRLLAASSALPKDQPAGANVVYAAKVREATGLPVIAVGKLGDATACADAVQEAKIDIIAIGRQMIVDPDTAGKILDRKGGGITPCKECMNCFATIAAGKPMACAVNKATEH
jgi:2,4-dienoyl-CoA reductase-like NADH-dependent reductase (Old Yellow Enzyme family)